MHGAVVLPCACRDEVRYPYVYPHYRGIGCGLDFYLFIIRHS